MAVPASVTYVAVSNRYVDPTGSPMAGRIVFTPSVSRLQVGTDNVTIVATSVSAPLDALGNISTSLMATNDTDVSPTGWTYTVREEIRPRSGRVLPAPPVQSYVISLPTSMAPGPVYLADIEPA